MPNLWVRSIFVLVQFTKVFRKLAGSIGVCVASAAAKLVGDVLCLVAVIRDGSNQTTSLLQSISSR